MNICKRAMSLVRLQRAFKVAGILRMQARCVHQRGYNDFYDDYSFKFHECNFALMNCKETD